jgi:hypothetical protein
MKFLAKIAPKARTTCQIGAVEPILDLLLQPIRRESPDLFLLFPAAQAFTNYIARVQVCARLDLARYELFQVWSESNFHGGTLARGTVVVKVLPISGATTASKIKPN